MTIIPMDVQKRQKQQQEIQDLKKYQLNLNMINATQDNYTKSESAKIDKYMIEALAQVRQNPGGIDTDYANATGTGLFHPRTPTPVKQKKPPKKPVSVSGLNVRPTQTNKPNKTKEVVIDETPIVPYDWNQMCKQLGKPRLTEQNSYFGSLRKSLQTKRKARFTYAD